MSKKLMCVALLCCLGWSQVAPAGLVGWWKLDETSGTKVSDAGANNVTGNFAGTGTPKWAAGKFGGALQLDGSSWVDFGNPAQALITGTTPVSISVWINPSNLGTVLSGTGMDRSFLARTQDWIFKASGPYARFTTPGVLDYNAMNTILKTNEWQHVLVVFQPGAPGLAVFYLNGVETDRVNSSSTTNGGYSTAATTVANPALQMGNNQFTTATSSQCYIGLLDEVQLYNRLLTAAQVKEVFAGARAYFPKAWNPTPADQAPNISQSLLQWNPGEGAASHNIYVGTTATLTAANLIMTVPALSPDFAGAVYPPGLTPGVTYYWRVDEVDAAGKVTAGDVWSFTATPKTAWNQKPADGAPYMPVTVTLSWMAGMNAVSHDVYLSADQAAVTTGAAAAKKTDKQTALTYAASGLTRGTTYYWRVDEHLTDNSVVAGPVWSFNVRPVFAKTDPSLMAWWKLDEVNSGYAADYSGGDYFGTLVGSPAWVDGYFGTGLKLNGTTDCVDFGAQAALCQAKTYTYSLWFQPGKDITSTSGTQYLLNVTSRSDLIFGVEDAVGAAGTLMLHYYDTTPGFHAITVNRNIWPAGEWHMATATKDAAGHKLYLDGVLKASDTNTKDDNFANTRNIGLGARVWTSPKVEFFNGVLDDVRIYNRALSADEITQMMRGDPLIAWNPQPSSATVDIRDVSTLTWSAGDLAVKHDVYFGTDRTAVKAADTTSPLYRGRQITTSFSLAGLATFGGGTYYWRIDEVEADGKTVHPGVIWSFTVPAYLFVDDFESYDDNLNRLYDTWIDGVGGNGSCSTVGNLPTQAQLNAGTLHFAETTIIHGGRQSMPVDYNNVKAPFYSEATRTFATPQVWTGYDANALSLWFRGRPVTSALAVTGPGQVKFGSNSTDVWGTTDSFRYYYKTLTGDGSISAKVIGITNATSTTWAKAGVMIRESLNPGSPFGFMFPTPDGKRAFQDRTAVGANATSAHSAAGQAKFPFWVKVERKGTQVTAYYSADGTTWTRQPDTENTGTDKSYNPITVNWASSVCLGLAVTSNDVAGTQSAFGEFSDVVTTGNVTGEWQLVRVGICYSNDLDPLYAAIEDSTGKKVTVTYADPAAVSLTAWTQWKIPLSSLTGLNLTKVKKVTLGVGNKTTPNAGTTGRMYFDDIFVTK